MTFLCVPITVHDPRAALADAHAAKAAGADLVEFRVDPYFTGSPGEAERDAVASLVSQSPLPCILTCRAASEGGDYDGPDDARLALYEHLGAAAKHPPRYLDLELAAYERSANHRQKAHLAVDHPARRRHDAPSLLLSVHDHATRPVDLSRRLARLAEADAAAVVKVAYRARSLRDNLDLFDILAHAAKPTIALGMGEFGLLSRVLASKFGAFLTFASLRPTTTTAPGQPTIAELLNLYDFRRITRATRLYGVIGYPLDHSLSPTVHNAAFRSLAHDAVYLPLPIPAGDDPESTYAAFKATLLDLLHYPRLDFSGASVTHPHKINLIRLAREQGWPLDEAAAATGAANTLVVRDTPRVLNTDAPAVLRVLRSAIPDPQGHSIAVLGAGGMARAAAWSLARAGAAVTVYARDPRAAAGLVSDLRLSGVAAAPWDALSSARHDAFIHATPIGMLGGSAPHLSPLSPDTLAANHASIILDTVYNPRVTPLLAEAARAGLRTLPGLDLFVAQAADQCAAWTGRDAPLATLRAAADAALNVHHP